MIKRLGKYTYVECSLETGRTHQIRVHLSDMGNPIIGDKVYGVKKEKFKSSSQMLHAKVICFTHPKTLETMQFDSGVPIRFEEMLSKLILISN